MALKASDYRFPSSVAWVYSTLMPRWALSTTHMVRCFFRNLALPLALISSSLASSTLHAEQRIPEQRSPFVGEVSISRTMFDRLHAREIEGLTLHTWTPLLGNVSVIIDTRVPDQNIARLVAEDSATASDTPSSLLLFRGSAWVRTTTPSAVAPRHSRRSILPVAGSLDLSHTPPLFSFTLRTRTRSNSFRVFKFILPIETPGRSTIRVRTVSGRALADRMCPELVTGRSASPELPHGDAVHVQRSSSATTNTRVLELLTDCDAQCAQRLGASRANDRIAEFVNEINTIYPEQLGISLQLVKQIRRTNTAPYPSSITDSLALLQLFRNLGPSLGRADAKHLLTGRALDYNVLGLAYTEAVCTPDNYFAYGLTTLGNSLLVPIIMAHELGHNLGASHDFITGGIMSPRLGVPAPETFSQFSRTEISRYISNHALSCLAEKLPELDFTASYRGTTFRADIQVPTGYSDCSVALYSGVTRRKQNTLLRLDDLSPGISSSGIFLTGVQRTRPKRTGAPVTVFLMPRAQCAEGELAGPLRTLKVSSKRISILNVKRAKNWMKNVAARLLPD